MTQVERLASFLAQASFDDLSEGARRSLEIRILDSLGCAVGAVGAEPVRLVRAELDDFGGAARSTLIGGGRTAPDRAAFYNGALVRYLDFNDNYLAPGETCHPSDNLKRTARHADRRGSRAWRGTRRGSPRRRCSDTGGDSRG